MSAMAQVLSVNRVHTLLPQGPKGGETAIDKQPVEGAVALGRLGLAGDRQMDVKHHGGPLQAVYAYASEDLDWWSRELGREIPHGFFGENLTTAGIDIGGARQGEQWRLGEADDPDHVVLQVTDSRIPCSTFQWRMREPRWVRRFADHGESGTYLSVVKEGVVRAGAVLEVVQVPEQAKTIREQFAEVMGRA
jgi:MOSC domain-containing protein YiiM